MGYQLPLVMHLLLLTLINPSNTRVSNLIGQLKLSTCPILLHSKKPSTGSTMRMWNRMIRDINSNKKKICTKNIYSVKVPSSLQSPLKNQFESGVKSLDD